jgi:flagellar hook-associated protein 3 FlgL
MRIATHAYTDAMLNQYNLLASKQYTLQNQVSTGLRVQAASDDPVAMRNTLDYAAEKSAQTQYGANITTLQSRGDTIYTALQSLQTVSIRVGEIATSAATGTASTTASSSDLINYADEVNTLINRVVTAANTKDPATGQYLFGGTASGSAPFTTTLDANKHVIAVTYNGNSSVNQSEIGSGQTTSVDIPGASTGAGGVRGLITDPASGADFLNHLISLRDNLLAGNKTAITSTDSVNLLKDENNLAYQVANNGVQQNQLIAAATFATSRSQSLDKMISNASSADIMQTMVQLNQAQTSYQAALQSGAKIMQLSILNYIQ